VLQLQKQYQKGRPDIKAALKALKLVNERFKEELSLPMIARELSLTPQYLSKSFASCFGVNFSQYLLSVRLKYAASGRKIKICFCAACTAGVS